MRHHMGKYLALLILLFAFVMIAGCGGDEDDESELVILELDNLSRLSPPLFYAAWVQTPNETDLLDTFNTNLDGTIRLSRFALLGTLQTGDRIFVTIEDTPLETPRVPDRRVVLEGTISGSTAILTFPRMQDLGTATGFATVDGSDNGTGNRQLFTEFFGLPDVSDLGFIYQGHLRVGNSFFGLRKFNSTEVPISETVNIDLTTAQYILSVEPVPDPDPDTPYSIQPFFTNGNLLSLIRQPLSKSSQTPGEPNFRFPSGIADIR